MSKEQTHSNGIDHSDDAPPVVLDALPYIDFHYSDPATQEEVDRLITEEMKKFSPPNYLSKFPEADLKFTSEFLQTEYDRVAANAPQVPLDMDRYKVEPPEGPARDDLNAWILAVERAQTQLEFQSSSLENLELLHRFGVNAWKLHCEQLQQLQNSLSQSLDASRKEIDAINRKRKADQLAVGSFLLDSEMQWWAQLSKNKEIEQACLQLEQELKRLKTLAIAQGLWKPPVEESPVVISDTQKFDDEVSKEAAADTDMTVSQRTSDSKMDSD